MGRTDMLNDVAGVFTGAGTGMASAQRSYHAVRWLLSDEAAFINGAMLAVDGG